MPKILERPEAGVPVAPERPVERPPMPPIKRGPRRFIRWMGLLMAIVLVAAGALIWYGLSSDDTKTGEVLDAPKVSSQVDEPSTLALEEPWTPAARGLYGLAEEGPWTPAGRGLPTVTEFDRPWTPASRGLPTVTEFDRPWTPASRGLPTVTEFDRPWTPASRGLPSAVERTSNAGKSS